MRLKNETSILGGYNPINWNNSSRKWEKTSDSFIFSLDKESILSRVHNDDKAIYQWEGGPNFDDLKLTYTFNTNNGVKYNKQVYDQKIHNEGGFIVDEYEVFSVVRKRN